MAKELTFEQRIKDAEIKYLEEIQDIKVLDDSNENVVVGYSPEEDTAVFVWLETREGDFDDLNLLNRRKCEKFAASWYKEHQEEHPELEDTHSFRFDKVELLILSDHRGLIRHHINACDEVK